MPKFHDKCQILVEEAYYIAKKNVIKDSYQVLIYILHAVETWLHEKHPDALIIAQHIWIIFEEMENQGKITQSAKHEEIPEGSIGVEIASDQAINIARRLFPPPKRHIF